MRRVVFDIPHTVIIQPLNLYQKHLSGVKKMFGSLKIGELINDFKVRKAIS